MNKLDSTMDDMANTRFLTLYSHYIKEFTHQTKFTPNEIASILMVYYKFVLVNGSHAKFMTKEQIYNLFLIMFKIYDTQIIERILLNISSDLTFIDVNAWVLLFSVFMSDDLELRMQFAYEVYNFHSVGPINREVVTSRVDKFFVGEDEDEVGELRADMVEFLINKFDHDKDGLISFQEYRSVVLKQPGLLEFLGQIYPSRNETEVIAYCISIVTYIQRKEL